MFKLDCKPEEKKAFEAMIIARLNDRAQPMERGDLFEDPLQEMMEQAGIGEVTGGGTQLSKTFEIAFCELEIFAQDTEPATVGAIIEMLEKLGAPGGQAHHRWQRRYQFWKARRVGCVSQWHRPSCEGLRGLRRQSYLRAVQRIARRRRHDSQFMAGADGNGAVYVWAVLRGNVQALGGFHRVVSTLSKGAARPSCVRRLTNRMSAITLQNLKQMFANMRAQTKWNVDGEMLWGYFFTDSIPEKA